MHCNTYKTNAPIICGDATVAFDCAQRRNVQLVFTDLGDTPTERFVDDVICASKEGRWCCVDGDDGTITCDALREAIYSVWLKGSWDHHPNFRFWIVRDGVGSVDASSSGGGVPNKLPYLIDVSALTLKYTRDFEDEFLARDLVSAVEDDHLYRAEDSRHHAKLLQPEWLVKVFFSAKSEDTMCSLLLDQSDENVKKIVEARDAQGRSALDAAIFRDFRRAAVIARNLGVRSETFDFSLLLRSKFQPMLNAIMDPWKPFPFEPIAAAKRATSGNRPEVLRKLFEARVDVSFSYEDYPLVEACSTGNMDIVWIVIDRMGATGLHPQRDHRIAAHFLVKLLQDPDCAKSSRKRIPSASATLQADNDEGLSEILGEILAEGDTSRAMDESGAPSLSATTRSAMRRRSSTNMTVKFNEAALQVSHWMADTCVEDEARFHIPLEAIGRAELYPELLQKVLRCIDVSASPDTEALLEFFIHFDPSNDLAREVVNNAVNDLAKSNSESVLEDVYWLVSQIMRKGEVAEPMARWMVERVLQLTLMPLAHREEELTVLNRALEHPPNVPGARALLELCPVQTKVNFANQIDQYGNNALKRMVIEVCQDPESFGEALDSYGDAVELLLQHHSDYRVSPPHFPTDLFTYCTRQDLGEMCFEMLNIRQGGVRGGPASTVLACSTNCLALMWRRLRRKEARLPPKVLVFAKQSYFGELEAAAAEILKGNGGNEEATATTNDEAAASQEGEEAATRSTGGPVATAKALREAKSKLIDDSNDVAVAAATRRTDEEKYSVPLPQVPDPVTVIDKRIAKAREPHPTFGAHFLSVLGLDELAHIASFASIADVGSLSATCSSWYHASLFDEVWAHRGTDFKSTMPELANSIPTTDLLRSTRALYVECLIVEKRLEGER